MPTILITGCDTGLGPEFAAQYVQEGWSVIATYRDLANALPERPGLRNRGLDLTDFSAFDALRREIADEPIDVLLSNAAVGGEGYRLGAVDYDYVSRIFAVNTLGPLKLAEIFVENVAASRLRKMVFISSRMGSIALNLSGGHYGYRASKAGLNAIARSLAVELYPRGITVTLLHPGWVQTPGGGEEAALTPAESVQAIRDVVRRLGNHETGQFLSYNGALLPW